MSTLIPIIDRSNLGMTMWTGRVSNAFRRLSAELSPYNLPLMSNEVLARIHETMVILIALLPDDWKMERERTYARQLRSWAVWVGLALYAPLAHLARNTEAAEAGNEPAGGFEEFNGERRDQ